MKKKKATKSDASEVSDSPATSNIEVIIAPSRDIRERSITAFQKVLNLVTVAGIDGAKIHRILRATNELKELVNEALLKNMFLEGQIHSLRKNTAERMTSLAKKIEEKLQETVPPKKPLTYAERVGMKARNIVASAVKEPRNIVTIFPGKNEELKSSDAVKEAVRILVSPKAEGIGIRNVTKIHNNGVLIKTDKGGDLETLLKNHKLKEAEMEVGLPSKRQPRIIVFGVPRPVNDEEAVKDLFGHNFQGEELTRMTAFCKIAFKAAVKTKNK